MLNVAIIGRPNVGKSTLFNRLIGKNLAIVHDRPGVTRDRKDMQITSKGIIIRLIDTAGLEEAKGDTLSGNMRKQTDKAIEEADVIIFLVDSQMGITPLDKSFAAMLRKQKKTIIVTANKGDTRQGKENLDIFYEFGLGEPILISAAHGQGINELLERVRKDQEKTQKTEEETEEEKEKYLKFAIVGRPNVGKSTLINALLQEERLVTGPEAGVTRDAIRVPMKWKGKPCELIDTAGLRKKAKVVEELEKLSTGKTTEAIRLSHVIVLVLDAQVSLDAQDLQIARLVINEGRALIIAMNKWDQVKEKQRVLQEINDRLERSFHQVKGIPIIPISAIEKTGLNKMMEKALEIEALWSTHLSTGKLNRWLEKMLKSHAPPLNKQKKPVQLKYITQAKSRPPTFMLFSNTTSELPESYKRYLINGLAKDFNLTGIPIRLSLRKANNPYANK